MDDIPTPGTVFGRKYEVERVLGRGGMSIVVAARRLHLDDVVALKFLLPDHCRKRDLVARFLREARAAAKIRSERIARVFDVDTLDDGTPFIVMELLEGQDLGERLATEGALAVPEAVELVLQACEVLAEAHGMGVVHRDLKPANLFLVSGPKGTPHLKVLDFGISKVRDGAFEAPLTSAEALVGSPAYMPPEQIASAANVDARADIWSLGVILYELVTGRRPFEADGLPALLMQIISQPAPDLCQVDPNFPLALGTIVARCLQKRVDERFQDVAELATALCGLGRAEAARSLARINSTAKATGFRAVAQPRAAEPERVEGGSGASPMSAQTRTSSRRGATARKSGARKAASHTGAPKGRTDSAGASKPQTDGSKPDAGNGDRVRTGVRDTGAMRNIGPVRSRSSQTLVAALKGQHLTIKLTAKQIDAALASRNSQVAADLVHRLCEVLEAHVRLEDVRLYPELRLLAERSGDSEMVALVSEFSAGMAEIGAIMNSFFERYATAVDLTDVLVEWPDVRKALFARLSAEEMSLYPLHQELAVAMP